jgi:hypothetical protein
MARCKAIKGQSCCRCVLMAWLEKQGLDCALHEESKWNCADKWAVHNEIGMILTQRSKKN